MTTKRNSDKSIEEKLGSLPDGGRVVPFFVSAHDRQKENQSTLVTIARGVYIGKAYLLKRISTPYTQKMNADFDVQRWSVLIMMLAPISDRPIDNTLGLKEYQTVECWIAENDLPKVLVFDAKQKDLFAQVPDDPTDDPNHNDGANADPKKSTPKQRVGEYRAKKKAGTLKGRPKKTTSGLTSRATGVSA